MNNSDWQKRQAEQAAQDQRNRDFMARAALHQAQIRGTAVPLTSGASAHLNTSIQSYNAGIRK